MPETPSFDAYRDALAQHAAHPVMVELTVLQLTMLLSTLQVALRHPDYPASMRPYVEQFITGAIENLRRLNVTLADTMAAGNDPTQDVVRHRTPEETQP
jgi:hypothetical protein